MMVNTMNAPLPLALAYDAQRDGTFVWVLRNFFSGLFSNSESYDRESRCAVEETNFLRQDSTS